VLRGWSRAWLLLGCFRLPGNPFVVCGPVLALAVRQFRHLDIVVVLHSRIARLQIESVFALLLRQLLLLEVLLSFSLGQLGLVLGGHGQPGVIEHGLGRCALIWIPMQHWQKEVSESLSLNLIKFVLFLEYLLERPEV